MSDNSQMSQESTDFHGPAGTRSERAVPRGRHRIAKSCAAADAKGKALPVRARVRVVLRPPQAPCFLQAGQLDIYS